MKSEENHVPCFHLERLVAPCGQMLVVTDHEDTLRLLHWGTDHAEATGLLCRQCGRDDVRLETGRTASTARRALEAYLAGDLHAIDTVRVSARGTAFQQEVWTALRTIQAGATLSYGALAAQIDHPKAVRAVGLANGSNPIAVVVPCHRVIGADGSLTGYGGGLERKRWLLEHEGADLTKLAASGKRSNAGSSNPGAPRHQSSSGYLFGDPTK
jgi:methylated-DNA-[protein]-cysteine S-methyltransferase